MHLFYGNINSKTVCFFFHGWTSQPNDVLVELKNKLDSSLYWVFINAPLKNNQWFEYDNIKCCTTNNKLEKEIYKLNLNYNSKKQIENSLQYISNIIDFFSKDKTAILCGTSQGATIALQYLYSDYKKSNVTGGWFHNPAGIYKEIFSPEKKYLIYTQSDTKHKNYKDTHSEYNKESINYLKTSINKLKHKRQRKNIFIFHSKNDKTIPHDFSTIFVKNIPSINYK